MRDDDDEIHEEAILLLCMKEENSEGFSVWQIFFCSVFFLFFFAVSSFLKQISPFS